jgi:diguanylate cyclase (GGDEF)-like protein
MKNQKFYAFLHKQIPVMLGLSLVAGPAYIYLGAYYHVLASALVWYGLVILVSLWGIRVYRNFRFEEMTKPALERWYREMSYFFYTIFLLWTLIFLLYTSGDVYQIHYVAIFTQMGTAVVASTLLIPDRRLYGPTILIFTVPLTIYFFLIGEVYGYALTFLSLVFSWLLFYAAKNSCALLRKTNHQASHDMLTGLSNRYNFIEHLQQVINQLREDHGYSYLLLIDLDHFKSVNDSLGHDVGDTLLQEVSSRLRQSTPAGNMLARLGGDEFIIVGDRLASREDCKIAAVALSNKLLEVLKLPYVINNHHLYISSSVGVSLVDDSSINANRFIKEADIAMYEVKASGRDGVFLFNDALSRRIEQHLEIERLLHFALINEEITLNFQAQVDADKNIAGAEVLVRWHNARLGAVSPAVFIPIAEQTGLIIELGNYILAQSLITLQAWHDRGLSLPHLSINISMRQFLHHAFVDEVRRLLELHLEQGLCNRLTFEITESIVAGDIGKVVTRMNELKALGIQFSMDDFGTGYSSLSNVKRLPIAEIKIDKAFVSEIEHHDGDQSMIKTILSMAELFDFSVVAEGVETAGQFDFLAAHGCKIFQGYYFSVPLSEEDFEQFYYRHSKSAPVVQQQAI